MAIVKTICAQTQFVSEFRDIDSTSFSVEALEVLFDELEELSESTGENIEFDPVAIRCDWAEYTEDELWLEFGKKYQDNTEELVDDLRREEYKVIEFYCHDDGKNRFLVQSL